MTSGTKVTTDPEGLRNPKVEGAGVVNSDSLAGESLAAGGDFAANGASVASSNQPARSTTTNTTDTSAATTLPPAPDARTRLENQSGSGQGTNDVGLLPGDNKTTGTVNAPPVHIQRSLPKGKNIKEGGFDSDDPNASFSAEIGGKNDPGRKALNEAAAKQGAPITSGGIGDSSSGITNDGQFDKLGETSA